MVRPRKNGQVPRAALASPTGLPYGEASQLRQAEQSVPLPAAPQPAPVQTQTDNAAENAPVPATQPAPNPAMAAQQAAFAQAPPAQTIDAPTTRPNEPLTAGLGQAAQDPTLQVLRGVYARYPSPDILGLIREFQARNPTA